MKLTGRETKSAKIAEIIRKELAAGRLLPGERLDGEYQLAEQFGVGRQVIRSAFQILKKENLIRSARGSGVYVNDYIPESLSSKPVRIGYVYWRGTLRENSFLHGYQCLVFQAKAKGCEIYLACEDDADHLLEWVHTCRLDGLFLSGYVDDALVRVLNQAGILFLLLGNYELQEEANSLGKDVFGNTKKGMSLLLKRYGFTQIAGIFGNLINLGPRQTLDGIRAAAEENHVVFDETCFPVAEDGNGHRAMQRLFDEKGIGKHTIVYLADLAFPGAARTIFERDIPPEERPYLFLDMPVSDVPYPDLVGCFLYKDNVIADQALDAFLALFYGKVKRPWHGNAICRLNLE